MGRCFYRAARSKVFLSLSRVLQLCGVPEDLAAFPDDLWGHRDHRPRAQPAMMTERAAVYTSGSPRAAEIQRPLCIWRHETLGNKSITGTLPSHKL